MELTKDWKKQRLLTMIFSALAIFFTGYPHVWSVYQPYIMEQAGWSQTQTSACFYLALASFVFGNIIGGKMQEYFHPKLVIWIGGTVFSLGILLSAFLIIPSPIPMYITYGVMQGFGQGLLYITVISTVQKWFPDKTGFASGVVVTANGLCGFFLAPISRKILSTEGPQKAFIVIGFAIAIACLLCLLFFHVPDSTLYITEKTKKNNSRDNLLKEREIIGQKEYTSSEMIHTSKFYLLFATMFLGLLSYFLVSPVSQTYQIEIGIPSTVAVSAVMVGSIVNAGTRLILPALSDKIGRVVCIEGVLGVSVVAMAILAFSESFAVTVAIVLMYGCYGGIMGSFPSFTSSIFGLKHTGENYGLVMLGIVAATGVASVLSGYITGKGYGMNIVFGSGILFALLALACLMILGKSLNLKGEKNGISNNEEVIESGTE